MASIQVKKIKDALTVNGTSDGLVGVASTSKYHAGMIGTIKGDVASSLDVEVTQIVNSTTLRLRVLEPNRTNYKAFGSMAAYTVADNATLFIHEQVVEIVGPYEKKTSLI